MEQEHALVVDPYIIVMGTDPGRHDMSARMVAKMYRNGVLEVIDIDLIEPPETKFASTQQVFDEICNHPWPEYRKAQPKELPYYCRFNKKKWR